jgi:hypothetical protein
MEKKVIGYGVSIFGLIILIFGAGGFEVPLLSSLDTYIVNIFGMVLVAGGVVIVIVLGEGGGGRGNVRGYRGKRKSKGKGKVADLPVYEGDDIIAYRRD